MDEIEKMKIQTENRFGYFREKTIEELNEIENSLKIDFNDWAEIFESNDSRSEQKTEAWNEIKFIKEQLEYIENLKQENKSKRR